MKIIKTDEFLSLFPNYYIVLIHDSNKQITAHNLGDNYDKELIDKYQSEGYGVFFAFNQFNKNRKKENCIGINAWAIDIDQKEINFEIQKKRIKQCPLEPSIIVSTKNGYHLYWLAKNAEIKNYENTMKHLICYFDADNNAKDISRLLRIPGYKHLKDPKDPFDINITKYKNLLYTEEDILQNFKEYYEPAPKNFWEKASNLKSKLVLETLSGIEEMNNDQISFVQNSNDTEQIYVNNKSTSCWIDNNGYIGSSDGGGPTWIQWLGWYGHSKAKIAHLIKKYKLIKEEKSTSKSSISIKNNCYYETKFDKDGHASYIKLTNFIINITNIFKNTVDQEIIREVEIINENNKKTGPFKISSDQLASLMEFKRFCLGKGNYLYIGQEKYYPKLLEHILQDSENFKVINLIPRIGYIEKFNIWLFENSLIDNEGNIYYADDKNIIWKNNDGFQCYSQEEDNAVTLTKIDIDTDELEIKYINNLCSSYGDPKIKLAISWLYGNIFSWEVYKKYKVYPFLYIYGRTRSGKDVLSNWLISVFGLDNSIKESLPQMRSTVGISRKAGYYSFLPLVLDEYKNISEITRYNGFFKNLAHKIGVTKGLKSRFGMYQEHIYSNFIFTAEELPEEPALLSRAIIIRINPALRNDSFYNLICAKITDYPQVGLKWITGKNKNKDKFFESIEKIKEYLIETGISTHTAEAYAIASAGYLCVTDSTDDAKEYMKMVYDIAIEDHRSKEESDLLSVFWLDLDGIATKGWDFKMAIKKEGDTYYIWLKHLIDVWNENHIKLRKNPVSSKAILDLIKETKSCLDSNILKKINGKIKRCVVLNENTLSTEAKMFFDNLYTNMSI
jgi:hypothetical protein